VRNIARRKGRKRGDLALPAPPAPTPQFRSDLARLRSDMDRLFEGFLRDPFRALAEPLAHGDRWVPRVDILDSDREVTVRAEVPGMDPKDLQVTVSGDTVTIAGQKSEEKEESRGAFLQTERRYGAFRRTLALPAGIDSQQVSAEYDNGVLTIRVSKTQEKGSRRIEVCGPGKMV